MRGRTIYYNNRRILVFCGYKRNTPHSIYDVFGRAAETATTGENNETFTTESNEFAESESGGAAGSDNDTFITNAAQQAETQIGISITQTAKANVYVDVYGAANSDLLLINDTNAINTETKLSNAESGVATLETAQALKTTVRLSESENAIGTGNESEAIKTEQHERAEAESGISSQQEIKAKNTSALFVENESGISTRQEAEANVTERTVTLMAGKYDPRDDITDFTAFHIDIPFSYVDTDDEQQPTYYANSIETEYKFIAAFQARTWVMNFDSQTIAMYIGNPYFWGCPSITVLQNTEVPLSQYYIFLRYFRFVSNL